MIVTLLVLAYGLAVLALTVWGINSLLLTMLSRHGRIHPRPMPTVMASWPTVTVQLPVYNERYVVERLIAAVAALDYPRDRLEVQVLDDSTDATVAAVARSVANARAAGLDIVHVRRAARRGFKAGALASGLAAARGELIAIFDADFVPPPDFLRRTVPYLAADPALGCVQARWEHLNAASSPLTRAQELLLDGHCIVEQLGRSFHKLPLAFTGTAGVWRRRAIESAGGWQDETLMEDLDLSYRTQLAGWSILLLPEVAVPAELPPQITALRQQQFRWAKGSSQVARKLLGALWQVNLPLRAKLAGTLHLLSYTTSALLLGLLLIHLPLLLVGELPTRLLPLSLLAALGPLAVVCAGQRRLRGSCLPALHHLPFLALLGLGLSVSNTRAVLEGLLGVASGFKRTPKFGATGQPAGRVAIPEVMRPEPIIWWEGLTALYALISRGAALALG
jgi:cellulose synthase/poly-beta-1,6-N-acetylglucosamine synthase-like glycosyltransferase